jgi:type I restriction enzyme R subunit
MRPASNFGFLSDHDPKLVQLGAFAERYFRDDPPGCLSKLRTLAELLAKLIAAHHALYTKDRETFEERLRRLHYDRIIPREVNDIFHKLRILGNAAAHEAVGNHTEALTGLKLARELAIWFHRTYGKKPQFTGGAFSHPREPVDDTSNLRAEIEGLQRRIVEIQTAANKASQEAADKASALESAEERLRREAEDRAVWEQVAQELETEKNQLTARLARHEEQVLASIMPTREELRELRSGLSEPEISFDALFSDRLVIGKSEDQDDVDIEATLAAVQLTSENAPRAETQALIERGEKAAAQIDLDEAATRALIDQQLRDSGWDADTKTLRFASGSRPVKGSNLAIAEWPTANGPADYALFAGLTLVGVVEAKRKRKNVSAAIDQAERYSKGLSQHDGFTFVGGPGGDHKVPFVFAANGRSYLKQIETESGIWFRDKVQGLIRSFRNDTNPRIAVTVDLLTTGIDVPSITNLVFLRRVTLPSPSARIIGPVSGRHCVLCLSEKRPSPLRPGDGFSLFRHELARQGSNPEPARVMAHTVTAWGGEHHGADRRPIADGITPLRHHHVERASAQTTDKPASGSYLCRRSPQSPAPAWSTAIR